MTAKFDPNVWYSISEARVDNTTAPLRSTLQLTDGGLRVFGLVDKQWQMQPVDDKPGRYLMRYSDTGPFQQLAICFDAGEIADSRSAACMGRSSTADNQKWDIVEWGDGTYRMHSVANGTGYALDVHPGSNLFMNNNIQGVNSDVYHKAQHWIWSSVKEVNEGAYSTIYSAAASTNTPQTTTADASSTGIPATTTGSGSESSPSSDSVESANGGSTENNSTSSGGGLSAGAAAGIGVAATLAVVGLALIGVFFWWKRRHYSKASNVDDSTEGGHEKHSAPPSHLYSTPPPQTSDDAVKANQYPPTQYPPAQNYQAHDQARGPSVDGYYGAQDKVTSPQTNITSPQSGYGQGHNQYPFEAPNQQIHEAPTSWHAELDAQGGGGGGGRPASGSGSGMNSVQNTPAVEFAAARHRQVL